MHTFRSEAVVLGVSDYREADRIVTLFTPDQGKVKGIARGAKRSVRRFGGALEPFARLTVELVHRGGLAQLNSADVVTIHPGIRQDLLKIGFAGYACELTDLFLPEGLSNPRLFRLLCAYLDRLDGHAADPSDRRFFEINLLNILGYRPSLDSCSSCGVADCAAGWRPGAGGELLCGRCGHGGILSGETISLLGNCLRIGRFGVVAFTPAQVAEAGSLLDPAIAAHLSRKPKSLSFLSEMGP